MAEEPTLYLWFEYFGHARPSKRYSFLVLLAWLPLVAKNPDYLESDQYIERKSDIPKYGSNG